MKNYYLKEMIKKTGAVVLTASLCMSMSACGNTDNSQEGESGSVSESSSDAAGSIETNKKEEALALSKSEYGVNLPNNIVKEYGDRIYINDASSYSNDVSYLNSYSIDNIYDETSVFGAAKGERIVSFCPSKLGIFAILATEGDTEITEEIIRIDIETGDSESLGEIDPGFEQITVSENGYIYLDGYSESKVYSYDGGKLSECTLDDADKNYTALIPDNTHIVSTTSYSSSSSSQYYNAGWTMDEYGKVFYQDDDGNFSSVDKDGKVTLIKNDFSQSVCALTDSGAVCSEYVESGNNYCIEYYYLDFESGKETKIIDKDASGSFLTIDQNGAYVGVTKDEKTSENYAVNYISFDGKHSNEVFNFDAEMGCDGTTSPIGFFCANSYGLFYTRSESYIVRNCVRPSSDTEGEFVFGGSVYDPGYSEAGVTINYDQCSYSYKSDEGDYGEVNNTFIFQGQIPQLGTETEAGTKINDYMKANWKSIKTGSLSDYLGDAANGVSYEDVPETLDYSTYTFDPDSGDVTNNVSSALTGLSYSDSNYICFEMNTYQMNGGAAHGTYANEYFLFDLATGERLTLSDVVGNSDDEIKAIVEKYFDDLCDKNPDTFFPEAKDTVAAMEPSDYTFYITNEGITIEFGIYEVSAYANGPTDLLIPYSEFDVKIPVMMAK